MSPGSSTISAYFQCFNLRRKEDHVCEAIWHYARGVALARLGKLDEAAAEDAAIAQIGQQDGVTGLAHAGIPAPEVLAARIAQARGDLATAAAAFERAAARQDGLNYMEPPYWYYPIRQSLGAVLLAAGKVDDAERAFQSALQRAPNNGWAIYGLVEVAKARGDGAGQKEAEARLERTWIGDRDLLDLKRL